LIYRHFIIVLIETIRKVILVLKYSLNCFNALINDSNIKCNSNCIKEREDCNELWF